MWRSVMAIGIGYIVYAALNMAQVMVMMNLMFFGTYTTDTVAGRIIYWIVDVVIGVAAGYVAAMIAGRHEVRHGLALGGVMLLIQVVSVSTFLGDPLAWRTLTGFVLTVVAATLGGWLRIWRKEILPPRDGSGWPGESRPLP